MSAPGLLSASRLLGLAAAALVAIQFVPFDRGNPPVEEEVPAPPAVRELLQRACYDCHSNETRWPWYSRVAPFSWLVGSDVSEAREHMNFSTWNDYDDGERIELLEEAWEQVEDGNMPLWFYLPLHPEANWTDADKKVFHAWVLEMTDG